MKIASWNVNSINVRLQQVLDWLTANTIDVLALQETKVVDDMFPQAAFTEVGYQVVFSGQKSYNGVAIIAKAPISAVTLANPFFVDPEKRFLAASINGVRVVNVYVPNGQSVGSEKFMYKLDYLTGIKKYLLAELKNYAQTVVLGDFNIAPDDLDVHDKELWQGSVLVSPLEREAFSAILNLGFTDALRYIEPKSKVYTWWDYRQGSFRRNNGLRIDHILLSKSLTANCKRVVVDKEPRKFARPSDHAPLWVEF
ncbi:MAG: exodeoxyribonuclease III [Legionellales bacterium RIFCSPHIGHO2_12_FULL_37_14]|nr:MAG: exodeoxyribonuclease III [Legionellales bacterium RIFCSPHIGHO2_12_FULL_37_14]